MFLTYVINADNIAVLRQNFKHIRTLLLFFVFWGKLPLCGESE